MSVMRCSPMSVMRCSPIAMPYSQCSNKVIEFHQKDTFLVSLRNISNPLYDARKLNTCALALTSQFHLQPYMYVGIICFRSHLAHIN